MPWWGSGRRPGRLRPGSDRPAPGSGPVPSPRPGRRTTVQAWTFDDWEEPGTARRSPSSAVPHSGTRPPTSPPRPSTRRWPPVSTISTLPLSTAAPRSCSGRRSPRCRDRLFVACKTLRHNGEGVRAQLEESLRLLNCDHFDLYQLHAVTDLEELDGGPAPWRRSWRPGTRACAVGSASPGTT